ncbi:MAG: Omp28-related outer membrane protein, partial [Bacteroidetes bacterium]|nr:Omp28-related outer membrane protein [Bacteroidota bacterium]
MHRKLFIKIILMSFLFIGIVHAQTPKWVSTEVQNRTTILENFMSVYYPVCADGQRTANEILQAFPNKFIIINIYPALLNYNNIKLSLPEGDSISNKAGPGGIGPAATKSLPAGSINRFRNPNDLKSYSANDLAMMSYAWKPTLEIITKQKSIVNVYVKPEFDIKTQELSVEVEYYYTDDSPVSENFLTIMLLQNEIVGYQSGGNKYNPDYASRDSSYRHMHVLRKLISGGGAWGDTITNTQRGTYGYKKYTLNLPESINNIPIDISNLEVVAFISESQSNIYTGHKAVIKISDDLKTDLSVEDATEYNNTLKFEPIHPKVKVTNNSDLPVTKFDIEYSLINTQTILYSPVINQISTKQILNPIITQKDTYTITLNKDESAIVELPEVNQSNFKAASTYVTQLGISNIYRNDAKLININKINNTSETITLCLIDTLFSETEITFENPDTTLTGLLPAHTVFDHSRNSYFAVMKSSDLGYTNHSCGANNTQTAVLYLLSTLYNVGFRPGYIIFGEVDCKNNPNKILSYYYAYSDQMSGGTKPRIVVDISTDWGENWQRISQIFCEETGLISGNSEIYVPPSDEYKLVQIDLSKYVRENFIIRIGCIPGTAGSALWLDEISIKNGPYEESIKEDINLSVYPNPATDILYINNDNLFGAEYEIYDMSGKLIIKDINTTNTINVEQLSTGTYSLKIKDSIFNFIKK